MRNKGVEEKCVLKTTFAEVAKRCFNMSDSVTKVTTSGFTTVLKELVKCTLISGVGAFASASALWLLDHAEDATMEEIDHRRVVAVATYNPMNNGELVHYQGELFCEPVNQARDQSASLIVRRRGRRSLLQEAMDAAEQGNQTRDSLWLEAYADELLHWISSPEQGFVEVANANPSRPEYVEINRLRSADYVPTEIQETHNANRSVLFMAPRHELHRVSTASPISNNTLIDSVENVKSVSDSCGHSEKSTPSKEQAENKSSTPFNTSSSSPSSAGFRIGDADQMTREESTQDSSECKDAKPTESVNPLKEADVVRIDDDLILIACADGALMIEREVEVFAWEETTETVKTDRSMMTNAETTVKKYSYTKEWISDQNLQPSSGFINPNGHTNPDPRRLPLRRSRFFAKTVQLGPFLLGSSEAFPNNTQLEQHNVLSEDAKDLLRSLPRKILPVNKALLRKDSVRNSAECEADKWLNGTWNQNQDDINDVDEKVNECVDLLQMKNDDWFYLLVNPSERRREIYYLDSLDDGIAQQPTMSHALRSTWLEQHSEGIEIESDVENEDVLQGPSIDLATEVDIGTRSIAELCQDCPSATDYQEPSPSFSPSRSEQSSPLKWLGKRLARKDRNGNPTRRPLSLHNYTPMVGDVRIRWTVVRGPIPLTLIAKQIPPLDGTFRELESFFGKNKLNYAEMLRTGQLQFPSPSSSDTESRLSKTPFVLPRLVDINLATVHQGRVPLSETLRNERSYYAFLFRMGKILSSGLSCICSFFLFKSIGSYVPEILLLPTLLKPTNYIYSAQLALSLLATAWISAKLTKRRSKRFKIIVATVALSINLYILTTLLRKYVSATYGPSYDIAKKLFARMLGL